MGRSRTAYLHLGIEKTGSTTLQSFLATNRDVLRQRGVGFPRAPGRANHLKLNAYAMAIDKVDDTRQRYGVRSPDDVHRFREKVREELHAEAQGELADCHKIIFSNEHCSERLTTPEEVRTLLDLVEPLVDNIVVIMYLREQGANMLSSYSTNLRNAASRLPDFDRINWNKYDYHQRVTRWSNQLGPSHVKVRIFDRSEFIDGDLTCDFMDALDEPLTDDLHLPVAKNTSLDARSLQFLRLFNEIGASDEEPARVRELRTRIVKALERQPQGPRLAFPPDKIQWLREACQESNRRVAREFLGRDQLFRDPAPSQGVQYSDPTAREVMETFVRIASEVLGDT